MELTEKRFLRFTQQTMMVWGLISILGKMDILLMHNHLQKV